MRHADSRASDHEYLGGPTVPWCHRHGETPGLDDVGVRVRPAEARPVDGRGAPVPGKTRHIELIRCRTDERCRPRVIHALLLETGASSGRCRPRVSSTPFIPSSRSRREPNRLYNSGFNQRRSSPKVAHYYPRRATGRDCSAIWPNDGTAESKFFAYCGGLPHYLRMPHQVAVSTSRRTSTATAESAVLPDCMGAPALSPHASRKHAVHSKSGAALLCKLTSADPWEHSGDAMHTTGLVTIGAFLNSRSLVLLEEIEQARGGH